jgi:hypothetical protein
MIFSTKNDFARRRNKEQGTRNIEVRSICQDTDLTRASGDAEYIAFKSSDLNERCIYYKYKNCLSVLNVPQILWQLEACS